MPVSITFPHGRRIGRAEICRHVNLGYAAQIADAAVHNQTATVRGFHYIVEEIVTHNGAVHLLSEQVDDEDIAGPEHDNGSLIGEIVRHLIRCREILHASRLS
jgi:hypothetical protein